MFDGPAYEADLLDICIEQVTETLRMVVRADGLRTAVHALLTTQIDPVEGQRVLLNDYRHLVEVGRLPPAEAMRTICAK